jgi:hypothetical protein
MDLPILITDAAVLNIVLNKDTDEVLEEFVKYVYLRTIAHSRNFKFRAL